MAETNRLTLKRLSGMDNEQYFVSKYASVGKIFSTGKEGSDRYYAELLIDHLAEMTEKLSIPRLSAYGISQADLEKIAGLTSNKNNPVKLTREDLIEILGKRL